MPNVGFAVQGNQRDIDANYALSDFDRPHRFSTSFIYELPGSRGASASRASSRCSPVCRIRFSRRSRSSGQPRSTRTSFAGREAFIDWRSAGRACAARWTSFASTRPSRATGRSTRRRSARRAASRAAIPTTRASAISGGTCCADFWQRRVDLSLARAVQVRRQDGHRGPVGRLQCVQHGELRVTRERDRRAWNRLRQDHQHGWWSEGHAVRRKASLLVSAKHGRAPDPAVLRTFESTGRSDARRAPATLPPTRAGRINSTVTSTKPTDHIESIGCTGWPARPFTKNPVVYRTSGSAGLRNTPASSRRASFGTSARASGTNVRLHNRSRPGDLSTHGGTRVGPFGDLKDG